MAARAPRRGARWCRFCSRNRDAIRHSFGSPRESPAAIGAVRAGGVADGVHGGYRLARPSNSISVADVVHVIDGPLALTACSLGDERCEQFSKCSVRDPLWRLRSRIQSALTTMTLEEMVQAVAR